MACLADDVLRRTVQKITETCSYSGASGPAIELEIVANGCVEALNTHFETTHHAERVVVFERSPAGRDLHETLRGLNVVVDVALDDLHEVALAAWRHWRQRFPEDMAHRCGVGPQPRWQG